MKRMLSIAGSILSAGILSDADDHGLMTILHGCTIPRGWERMYPNYDGFVRVM